MPLAYLSAAWVAGVYLGSIATAGPALLLLGLLPLCLTPFLSGYRRHLFLAGFCLFALVGGSLRFNSDMPVFDQNHIQFYNESGMVEIQGKVAAQPEGRDTHSTFELSGIRLCLDGTMRQVSGKALIRVPKYQEYSYGDILRLNGRLETPPVFDDFNYRNHLANQGIYSVMSYPGIEIIERGRGSSLLSRVYSLRSRLSQSLSSTLPEPQSSLAQGILLGLRGNIPDSLRQAFSRTGTSHLLAISGLHLSIMVGILLGAGIWLFGRRYSIYIWLALLGLWLYVLLTGLRPPIVRGAIMGSLFLIAEALGRQRAAGVALTFAAAVMVGLEPRLLWDTSFQLSFLAMAGLVFIFPYLRGWARKLAPDNDTNKGIATSLSVIAIDSFAVSFTAVAATWPVVAYNFKTVSLVGIPATLLSLPSLPGIIIITALAGIAGLWSPFLAQILSWAAWLFLSYFLAIVQLFNSLPFSSVEIGNIPAWQVWSYYILLSAAIAAISHRRRLANFLSPVTARMRSVAAAASGVSYTSSRRLSLLVLLIAAILVWAAVLTAPGDSLRVSILDIGQGDAILIQTPNRQDILIDGGPSPQAISLQLGKKLPFWDRTIDLLVLTQPHADHVTGLVEVAGRYQVKQAIGPAITYSSGIYQQCLKLLEEKRIKYQTVHTGQHLDLGDGVKIDILHPPASLLRGTSDDIDNNDIVLRLSWKEISFLFTADVGQEAEQYLMAERASLQSTVLKVAHHGSRTSTSRSFLAVVAPDVAAISAGGGNQFGHPHREVLDLLSEYLGNGRVYTTLEHGNIEFITDGKRLWVKTEPSTLESGTAGR